MEHNNKETRQEVDDNSKTNMESTHLENGLNQDNWNDLNNNPRQNNAQNLNNSQYQYNQQNSYNQQSQNQSQLQYNQQNSYNQQSQNQSQYPYNQQNPYNLNGQQNPYRQQNQYNIEKLYKRQYQNTQYQNTKYQNTQNQYDGPNQRQAKYIISYAGFALFILALAVIGSQTLLELLTYILVPSATKADWYIWALTAASLIGISFPIYYLFMRGIPNSPKGEVVKLGPARFIKIFFITAASMYITNILSTILTFMIALLQGKTELSNPAAEAILNSNYIISLIYAAIAAPVIEEIIFRKILLDKLRRFGDVPAILMTGIAFGLFHMNLSQFFYAAVLGFIFAYVTLKTNTIRYSIALHMMVNLISTVMSPFVSDMNVIAIIVINVWVYGSIVVGVIFLLLNIKKIRFNKAVYPIKNSLFFFNAGTILYSLICLAMIVIYTLAA